jgi:aminoglycoside phosphotransferase (APT) family kinase protein
VGDLSTTLGDEDLPGLPFRRLRPYLREQVPEISDPRLRASLISGGRSNLTYLLTDGRSRWVLRRPPLGAVLETAHDMGREFRMIDALHPTGVPVPRPVHLAGREGESVLGAPFYIMGFAEGSILRERDQLLSVAQPADLARQLMRTLASLHDVVPDEVGLGDLGRPDGYLERQLDRWLRQVASISSPLLPRFEAIADALRGALPQTQRTSLVHGDYRLDNVVVDADGGINAVLDWEMATRGDPLADVANTLVWWDGMRDLDSPVATHPGDVPGYPAREVLVSAYAEMSDLDLSRLDWYLDFASYKIAAIFEGIRHRHDAGHTVGDGFDRLGPLVPHLLDSATAGTAGLHTRGRR